MRIRLLGWAGVEIDQDGHTLIIDCIEDSFPLISREEFVSPSKPGRATAALVTHLHLDHAGPVVIAAALAASFSRRLWTDSVTRNAAG
jgi:L-ascorbate metabolism protein UlaG (beta-lactamase superfamily)